MHNYVTTNGWGYKRGFMKQLTVLALVIAMFGATFLAQTGKVSADRDDKDNKKTTQSKPTEAYSYTAQPGDSYTLLARKAIQTYGLENKINLSSAQIVYAETNLTKEASSPDLNTDQKLELKKDTVKAWIDKARKLSEVDKKAWNYYVQFVDFDTRDNGEVKKT